MPPGPERRVLAIVGPTAAGKSAIALELARDLPGEIVNADSRQVYRGMDIGTAKPPAGHRAIVPHHLFDIADPRDAFSLALYRRCATEVIAAIHARSRVPVLAGGTGQYVWGLLEGWNVPEVPPDEDFRRNLAAVAASRGPLALHERLRAGDPAAAASIDARNVRRVIRALEVQRHTGQPFSALRQKQQPPWDVCVVGVDLPDAELDGRIEARVDEMLAAGLVDEVRNLLQRDVPRTASAMLSIGYREIASHLDGECTLDEARTQTIRATRRLARRQRQWFRRSDPRITWVGSPAEARAEFRRAFTG